MHARIGWTIDTGTTRQSPLHLTGYGPKGTRILGAGVSVHLNVRRQRRESRCINRACKFNHEERTNEFTVYMYACMYIYVCVCVRVYVCARM